jgi:hypothetical protein
MMAWQGTQSLGGFLYSTGALPRCHFFAYCLGEVGLALVSLTLQWPWIHIPDLL